MASKWIVSKTDYSLMGTDTKRAVHNTKIKDRKGYDEIHLHNHSNWWYTSLQLVQTSMSKKPRTPIRKDTRAASSG
jgi:hypothetical protein